MSGSLTTARPARTTAVGRAASGTASRRAAGWRLLGRELASRPRPLVRVALWSAVEAGPPLLSGVLIAAALDRGFLAHRPWAGLGWLLLFGLALALRAAAVRRIFPALSAVVEPLRDALVRRTVTGSLHAWTTGREPQDAGAVARLTEQVETVRNLVAALLRTFRQTAFALAAAVLGVAALSGRIALLVLPFTGLALLVLAGLLRTLTARQHSVVLADEALAREAGPVLDALRDVTACGATARAGAVLDAATDTQARAVAALGRAAAGRRAVVLIGAQLPLLAVVLALPGLVADGLLSAGAAAGAVTYLVTGLDPALRSLTTLLGTWGVQLDAVLGRLAETTAAAPTAAGTPDAAPPGPGALAARGLTFRYGPHAAPVVDGLDLDLAPGDHLAVTGPSGIGKSTLALLLTGLETPSAGGVRLDGVPLEQLPAARLRREVALIPQEAYVFAGTVRENLCYLAPDAEPAAIGDTVRALGLGPLLERLGGLDAELAAPGELSAGERQLIALARVHLSPARLTVLDEASCHLDPAAEARVEAAFAARPGTLVVIAHRAASARRARRVLHLDGVSAHLSSGAAKVS
ncbi:ATP-binding cassette domain-containing protein [Streptomyces sp. TLI_171]|uniref:ATP-binding cassette domain-containing protein n=1 Tax=Streptomyces sp. TLI_171 TaxID=1938859 RepID=UPI000C18BA3A|nr:ATP-binding cassette domain-containing protein [Streptomyces sp. TLI_171]RKE17444.1 ATP-binding cassette subfamily C protein [Streptomyces sp. TLI_171]